MTLPAPAALSGDLAHPAVQDMIADGAHIFPDRVVPGLAAALLADIRADRNFDHRLFLTEAEFDADPQYTGVNPKPGRNLLERFEDRPVHQQFVFGLPLVRSLSNQIKVLHRQPRWFKALAEHGPRGWNLQRYGRSLTEDGMYLVNAKGDKSWPISTASFILMYKQPADKVQSAEVLKFFDWAFKNGKQMAADLDYVALPDTLTNEIRSKVWSQVAK